MKETDDNTADAADDDDEYSPDLAEAQSLADMLLSANSRARLRGKKGEAIREVQEISGRLATWDRLPPAEKRRTVNRLWQLNSGDDYARHEILGFGRYPWRGKGRPAGIHSDSGPADSEMIKEALALEANEGLPIGTALRKVIGARCTGHFNVESVIKRLRRKIGRDA